MSRIDISSTPLDLESPYPITIGGKKWFTAYAYIQSMRYVHSEISEKIRLTRNTLVIKNILLKEQKIYNPDTKFNSWGLIYDGNIIHPSPGFDEEKVIKKVVEYRFRKYKFMKDTLKAFKNQSQTPFDPKNDVHTRVLMKELHRTTTI